MDRAAQRAELVRRTAGMPFAMPEIVSHTADEDLYFSVINDRWGPGAVYDSLHIVLRIWWCQQPLLTNGAERLIDRGYEAVGCRVCKKHGCCEDKSAYLGAKSVHRLCVCVKGQAMKTGECGGSHVIRNCRLPEPTWAPGRGGVTVIGDALHPTQPTLAQGGCMAIVRGLPSPALSYPTLACLKHVLNAG